MKAATMADRPSINTFYFLLLVSIKLIFAFGSLPIPRRVQNECFSLTGGFSATVWGSSLTAEGVDFPRSALVLRFAVDDLIAFFPFFEPSLTAASFFASASVKTFCLPSTLPNFFCQAYCRTVLSVSPVIFATALTVSFNLASFFTSTSSNLEFLETLPLASLYSKHSL